MTSAFVGEADAQAGDGDPEDLFKVDHIVAGDSVAPPVIGDRLHACRWPA